MDDNNKAFPRVICTLRGSARGGGGWKAGRKRKGGMDERRRGAVSHRFEAASLQFMTRVGLRGTSRVKGG